MSAETTCPARSLHGALSSSKPPSYGSIAGHALLSISPSLCRTLEMRPTLEMRLTPGHCCQAVQHDHHDVSIWSDSNMLSQEQYRSVISPNTSHPLLCRAANLTVLLVQPGNPLLCGSYPVETHNILAFQDASVATVGVTLNYPVCGPLAVTPASALALMFQRGFNSLRLVPHLGANPSTSFLVNTIGLARAARALHAFGLQTCKHR